LRFQGVCYRGHDPKWAVLPLSGEGASKTGGRFNPQGVPSLYLGLTIEGVFAEQTHGLSSRFEPLTVCCYDVDVDDIVDLRTDDGRHAAGVKLADMSCAWHLDMSEGREPASWRIANQLRKNSAGILVPSFAIRARPEMHNLVLWKWGPNLPHQINVNDPSGRLPKNQLSWDGSPLGSSPGGELTRGRQRWLVRHASRDGAAFAMPPLKGGQARSQA